MKRNVPMLQNVNYPVFLLQLLVIAALVGGFSLLFWDALEYIAIFLIAAVLVIYIKAMQQYLMRYARAAMRLMRAGKFEEALIPLQQGLEFYNEHPQLDRLRHVMLVTASLYSLRETVLMNIAYCYGQIGDKEKMVKHYERLAREYPENTAAQNTLRFIDTAQSQPENIDQH